MKLKGLQGDRPEREMGVELLVMLCLAMAASQQVDFFNCHNRSQARVVSKAELCQGTQVKEGVTEEVVILQRREIRLMRGFSCQLISSKTFRCSVWSHFKLVLPPTVMQPVTLSHEQCESMIRTMSFADSSGTPHALKIGHNVIRGTEKGVLQISDAGVVSCQGGNTGQGGAMISQMVRTFQYDVSILPETFHLLEDQKILAQEKGVVLADECTWDARGCQGLIEFMWAVPEEQCDFKFVHSVSMTRVEEAFFSDKHKLVL